MTRAFQTAHSRKILSSIYGQSISDLPIWPQMPQHRIGSGEPRPFQTAHKARKILSRAFLANLYPVTTTSGLRCHTQVGSGDWGFQAAHRPGKSFQAFPGQSISVCPSSPGLRCHTQVGSGGQGLSDSPQCQEILSGIF